MVMMSWSRRASLQADDLERLPALDRSRCVHGEGVQEAFQIWDVVIDEILAAKVLTFISSDDRACSRGGARAPEFPRHLIGDPADADVATTRMDLHPTARPSPITIDHQVSIRVVADSFLEQPG
jgi:hypothetical protein